MKHDLVPEAPANGNAVARHASDEDVTRSVASSRAVRDQLHPGDQLGTFRVVRAFVSHKVFINKYEGDLGSMFD